MNKTYTIFMFIVLFPVLLKAQWNGDPASVGAAVCTASTNEGTKISITDGSNGSIVVFESSTYNTVTGQYSSSIKAQRITSTGTLAWSVANTPKVISEAEFVSLEHAIPDGAGGAFIVYRIKDVIVQHINNTGNVTWAADGIKVTNNPLYYNYGARLCADGSGGVIVSWTSEIYDETNDLYEFLQGFAQRINSAGTTLWTTGGVQVSTAPGFRALSDMVTDGAGGAIVFMVDTRNSDYLPGAEEEFPNLDIYAQRISAAGNRMWTDNGAEVSTNPNTQYAETEQSSSTAISDGAGGAILVYNDYRNGNAGTTDLYSQRINSAGVKQWASGGVFVCVATGDQYVINVVSNSANGIVVLWEDERSSSNNRIYTQQVSASGTTLWTTNGVLISGSTDQADYGSDIKPDGLGNYIAAWNARQSGMIKVQKINNTGVVQWPVGGINIYSNPNSTQFSDPSDPQVVISDIGTAIITYKIYRTAGSNNDIFAKKIESNGVLPLKLVEFTANVVDRNVLLNWLTANEQNTLNFEIERSNNNLDFTYVGKVTAAGFSSTNRNYRWVDKTPQIGVSFYRLKQNDKDGLFTYSPIRKVVIDGVNNALKLLGNPVLNEAILKYESSKPGKVQVKVIDQSGKIMLTQLITAQTGTNQIKLLTSQLAAGIYQVEVIGTNDRHQLKMMKK